MGKRSRRPQQPRQTPLPSSAVSTTPTHASQVDAWLGWIGLPILAVLALFLLGRTWGTWPDLIVDFGRELYVPWRLTVGDKLYHDLAYFNGPLSPYLNACWFALFGVSLRVLALANFGIACVLVGLLYTALVRIGSRVSALLSCLVFVCVFAFSVLGFNFNYICPYSHEMTHGLVLSLAALLFTDQFARRDSMRHAFAAGLCVGLVSLTKPEIFVALLPAVVLGGGLALYTAGAPTARWRATVGIFAGGVAVPVILSVALLSLGMSVGEAARGTAGGLRWMFSHEVRTLSFYQRMMGTFNLPLSLSRIGTMSVAYCILFIPPIVAGYQWRGAKSQVLPAAIACWAITAGGLWWFLPQTDWGSVPLLLPFLTMLGCFLAGQQFFRATPADRGVRILPVTFATFALLLMIKVFLNVRMDNYGFALALPATGLFIVLFWDWVPAILRRAGGSGLLLQGVLLGVITIDCYAHMYVQQIMLARRTTQVGTGGDAMWWDDRGAAVNEMLATIDRQLPADGTMIVAPEGVMLNYLARRRNPTPYFSYMPLETRLFDEQAMLAALEEHPPDAVVAVSRELREYGLDQFGQGYAEQLRAWILANYQPVDTGGTVKTALQMNLLRPKSHVPAKAPAQAPGAQPPSN